MADGNSKIQTSLAASTFQGRHFWLQLGSQTCNEVVYQAVKQISTILSECGSYGIYLKIAKFGIMFYIVIIKPKGLAKSEAL